GALRLVPFPKEVTLQTGSFRLDRPLVVRTGPKADSLVSEIILAEVRRAGAEATAVVAAELDDRTLELRAQTVSERAPECPARGDEAYALRVSPSGADVRGAGPAGLRHGAATLAQLIRANRGPGGPPCLLIRDWPSLRWRCFLDDLTRGPSALPTTLERELDLGASIKFNMFTYYMEYQYAFQKHPDIGPLDGSLRPEDLARLVARGKARGIEILGNQQSFGHFGHILASARYAPLRETADVLSPMKDETYQLLDDLYSEECPLLPFEMFNVCCDETFGLGTGTSKALADKIGVAGVYVRHMRRVHDLLRDRYHKRMMMWGDIIVQHPDRLTEIPKDTVMLAWDYAGRPDFHAQIAPFAKAGYTFFVCPGVSNWSRILPDFLTAETNIRNFVRDGLAQGALGMINTSWEDDGEALKAVVWHGHAWAAECAWNGSTTEPAAFNRRVGAVLFGEQGDHFGQAISLLAKTHALPGMAGMNNSRFWQDDFFSARGPAELKAEAGRLLPLVRQAAEHLEACRKDATVNAELLDAFQFGARRMDLIGRRMLDGLEARREYDLACQSSPKSREHLARVVAIVRQTRDAHETLAREFTRLWLRDCRPYALDWTIKRYKKAIDRYDTLLHRLDEARSQAEAGKPLPSPTALGLRPARG
ncbi:MAG: glycoside hydrolase family 20 zincin-like fold domain-containing protein, partial [Isosphaeraceae bacterium]